MRGGVLAAEPYSASLHALCVACTCEKEQPLEGCLFCALRPLCVDLEYSDYLAAGTAALGYGLC
ncbi:hypothetical protein P3T40_002277 [Paraburkholderia sp. EB58]|jgi:hypothetical protein